MDWFLVLIGGPVLNYYDQDVPGLSQSKIQYLHEFTVSKRSLAQAEIPRRKALCEGSVLIGCAHDAVNRALKKFWMIRKPSKHGRLGYEVGWSGAVL